MRGAGRLREGRSSRGGEEEGALLCHGKGRDCQLCSGTHAHTHTHTPTHAHTRYAVPFLRSKTVDLQKPVMSSVHCCTPPHDLLSAASS